ncbi:MAG: hypothetical protein NVS3B1_07890 [Marmoricola sp.]
MPDPIAPVVHTPAGELVLAASPNDALGPVTASSDLRVLIPRCRRAIDGPRAMSSAAVAATFDDSEVLALVADSTAEVILLTGGSSVFGYKLIATHVDPFYLAPDQWATDQPLSPEAQDVVIAQAAINVHLHRLRENPYTAESIGDEGQTWSWEKSANVLVAHLKLLAEVRDRSLELLRAMNAPLDAYFSLVAERDKLAAVYLEPYVSEVGAPVPYAGLSGAYTGGFDFRFGTFG